MNVLSLFSGIGGLELGLERAGMTVVGQVEIDEFCRRVLAKHWPEVPRHDDVRTAVEWWLGAARPRVDVVCGGFPCQPFSTAGRQKGLADERWGWPWFWDVVRVVRPGYVLLENVAALTASADAFGWILADLAAGGYDAEWDCIPAAAVGAPHLRDRVFLVAHVGGKSWRVQPIAESGSGRAAVARDDGSAWNVAHADGQPGRPMGDAVGGDGGAPVLRGGATQPRGRGRTLANTDRQRQLEQGELSDLGWGRPSHSSWWSTEPDVGRVAHGVSARVDRLRALGNAVVPQVAEHIGRLVMGAAS